jgi:HSP20 family molecular chaperone IbpA
MRSMLRPILIGLTGFLLGGACVYAFLSHGSEEPGRPYHPSDKPIISAMNLPKNTNEDEIPPPPSAQARNARPNDDMDEEDALLNQAPFLAMQKMREEMEKEMRGGGAGAMMGFDIESGGAEITAKEDAKSVSYEIKDVVGGTLNTQVSNGMLTVSGESKQIHGSISMQSSFQRSFSLPPNVDAGKMETISEKDRVVLRFPKKS